MNKAQRITLATLQSQIEDIKATLEEMAGAERDKFDNLNEGLQASEKGQRFEAAADALDEAASATDEILSAIETALE